ncbi:MAG: ammonium transporter [Planctomycetaceae bacterium]|nr:ammonium transporter [Planctomycetaceae bacterium]
MRRSYVLVALALSWLCSLGLAPALAQEEATPPAEPAAAAAAETTEVAVEEVSAPADDPIARLTVGLDTLWVMVCGILVFFMNLGFGCVESGFCRAKNTVNILSKNFVVFAATSIGFWLLGWGLMFGNGTPYYGNEGIVMVGGTDNSPAMGDAYSGAYGSISWAGVPLWAKFFFQLVFAGTAATIVSGAVAERIKYIDFILFSFVMAVAIYPITGHWIWGGGWLAGKGMFDFAGSTVVHSVGGWAALTGAIILGPRIGKYSPDGKVNAIPGHNMTAAFIGCLVLWFGWFGFNPGSTMGVGDGSILAEVAVTTNTAAAAATLSATATAWILLGKPDIGMTLNGCLAGLVAITAPCAFVTVGASAIIGLVAGVLVVLSVIAFDRARVDDPVGATSVHLVNGIWGTLCVGLFAFPGYLDRGAGLKAGLFYGGGVDQTVIQAIGIGAVGAYVVVVSTVAWLLLKFTIGLRVTPEEEIGGLDMGEHGNEAYPGFVMQSR